MRNKTDLYLKDQNNIIEKIISILNLDEKNSFILYEMDNDEEKKYQLISLIPTIRKFFSFSDIRGVRDPDKVKRPWLSLVRQITKCKYDIFICDYRLKLNDNTKPVRTRRYHFHKKDT